MRRFKLFLFAIGILLTTQSFAANVVKLSENGFSITYKIEMIDTEKTTVAEKDVTVSIENLADYRCPPHVMCLWEGGINFDLTVTQPSAVSRVSHLYKEKEPTVLRFLDYDLFIDQVVRDKAIYKFQMTLTKQPFLFENP